ncbi:MAG: hypothetical protein R3F65_18375 [bacterium]
MTLAARRPPPAARCGPLACPLHFGRAPDDHQRGATMTISTVAKRMGGGLLGLLLLVAPTHAKKRCPDNEEHIGCGPDFPSVTCRTRWSIKCDEGALATCRAGANARIAALDALLIELGSDRTGLNNGHAEGQLDGRIRGAQREVSRLRTDIGRLQAQLDAANGALPGVLEKKAQLTEATASTRRALDGLAPIETIVSAGERWTGCQRGHVAAMQHATKALAGQAPALAIASVTESRRLLYLACHALFASPPMAVPPGASVGPSETCAFDLERERPTEAIGSALAQKREAARVLAEPVCRALDDRWRDRLAALEAGQPLPPAQLEDDLRMLDDLVMPVPGGPPTSGSPPAAAHHAAVAAVRRARGTLDDEKARLAVENRRVSDELAKVVSDLGKLRETIDPLKRQISASNQALDLADRRRVDLESHRGTLRSGSDTLAGPDRCDQDKCQCVRPRRVCDDECPAPIKSHHREMEKYPR